MHHFSLRQFGRTLFTIAGIVLLIIFGERAASQAGSLAAVGGEVKKAIASANEGLSKFAGWTNLPAPQNTRLADMAVVATVPAGPPPATASDPQPIQAQVSPEPKLGTGADAEAVNDTADNQPAAASDQQNDQAATDQSSDDTTPKNTTSTAFKTEGVK